MEKKTRQTLKKTVPSLWSCVHCESSEDEEGTEAQRGVRSVVVREVAALTFRVNGKDVQVDGAKILPSLSLAKFLRDELHLTGTKLSCAQGGCGACVVTAGIPNGPGGTRTVLSVNACLVPVAGCDSWEVTTVEGLGGRRAKLHPIQKRLAAFHGTQCGFCTPGMVMQMNSLMSSGTRPTLETVERVLDGNLCRCTGYRPILDAFKTFAVDAPDDLAAKVTDVEDLCSGAPCQTGTRCAGPLGEKCGRPGVVSPRLTLSDGSAWHAPWTVEELLTILDSIPSTKSYRIVGGNTGRGVFDSYATYDDYVSVRRIPELASFEMASRQLNIGSAVTLNALVTILEDVAKTAAKNFIFAEGMAKHVRKVANTGIRNSGTLAGNLMLKHAHNQFPSDIFVLLESVGAKLVVKSLTNEAKYGVREFLSVDMTKKIIQRIELPASTSQHRFGSYKITPRSENAHAYVNAACYVQVDEQLVVQGTPSLVFGGISNTFVHATKTEAFLIGKKLNDIQVITAACKVLSDETQPTSDPVMASLQYRKYLPQALFYKFVLLVLGDQVDPKLRSGSVQIQRGISSGQQHYETDPSLYPVNKPILKIEGQSQCTGEAEFVDDIPTHPNELYAAFVLSTIGNCEIDSVDPSDALAIPGVVAYFDHTSIPGKNSCVTYNIEEPIFSEGRIEYAGQAIGVVVADTLSLAIKGAHTVKVSYKNRQKPILSIKEALQQPERIKDAKRPQPFSDPIPPDSNNLVQVSGEFEIGSQYHFHMETQSVIVRPKEDLQLEIVAACQWMDNLQVVVSQALKIPTNSIEVKVRRLGGAYGGKARPTAHVAAAAAIAAFHLNRPVRLIMDLKSNMELMGKRFPFLAQYQAGATPEGRLIFVFATIYCDCGFTVNEATSYVAAAFAKNCYKAVAWNIRPKNVLTNTPSNTFCRAPGTTQGVAIIENIMDHLATSLGMDPLEFRLKNLVGDSPDIPNPLPEIIPTLRQSSDYDRRLKEIQEFNQNNLWKKRGMAFVPLCYPFSCSGTTFYFQISIFAFDGTVVISHGGTEMGQGINTKVVQTVAQQLGLSVDQITLRPTQTFISPNTSATWGSTGTDATCTAAIQACKDLKDRMGKVAETMNNPSWFELVQKCYNQGVDLSARYMGFTDRDGPADYFIWSGVVTEVEVDVLTGEKNVRRVDMIEDIGTSINPEIDVGQLEGAFVMSLGLWMTEEIKYDPDTGRLLTADTWEYKPPACHDIPEDFRTTFYNGKKGPSGVLGSKATGEPSVLMGISALLAIHRALAEARKDLGKDPKEWFQLSGPATCERTQLSAGITSENFKL